tara:strand:+ start:2358 stop:3704 length:1347 start_codon:yes stop_codon:yes gene_type:complete
MPQKKFNLSVFEKIKPFKKTIIVYPDKSISIRSLLIGSISNNISYASNVLESDDVTSSIKCLKKLGVKIIRLKNKEYKIYGNGLGSYKIKNNLVLDFGNSGTLARLLIGILSSHPNVKINMTGDKSLRKRSMKKLLSLMSKFGASFYPKNKFNFPLKMISSPFPIGIIYESGISAQLKSAVIFAALNSFGETKIIELQESRNHTENMLLKNKQTFKISKQKNRIMIIKGKKYLNPLKVNVPNDPSSAAFFTALTILNEKSSLIIKNVGLNPTRIGFYQLLKRNGAKIKFKNIKKKNEEIQGDIHIKSCKLKPIHASKKYYVNSTDEYPILFAAAALIRGTSSFKGISDLANKESNRIIEMQKVLSQLGVKSKLKKGVFKIFGKGKINYEDKIINIPNLGDHRICMSSFILGLLTGAKTKIKNFETVFTSSPSFLNIMKSLGAKFEIQK